MQITDLHYNHRISAFEANVVVNRASGQLHVPCRVPGQMSLDHTILQKRMARQATRKVKAL